MYTWYYWINRERFHFNDLLVVEGPNKDDYLVKLCSPEMCKEQVLFQLELAFTLTGLPQEIDIIDFQLGQIKNSLADKLV